MRSCVLGSLSSTRSGISIFSNCALHHISFLDDKLRLDLLSCVDDLALVVDVDEWSVIRVPTGDIRCFFGW
jgi:hypothetical protein